MMKQPQTRPRAPLLGPVSGRAFVGGVTACWWVPSLYSAAPRLGTCGSRPRASAWVACTAIPPRPPPAERESKRPRSEKTTRTRGNRISISRLGFCFPLLSTLWVEHRTRSLASIRRAMSTFCATRTTTHVNRAIILEGRLLPGDSKSADRSTGCMCLHSVCNTDDICFLEVTNANYGVQKHFMDTTSQRLPSQYTASHQEDAFQWTTVEWDRRPLPRRVLRRGLDRSKISPMHYKLRHLTSAFALKCTSNRGVLLTTSTRRYFLEIESRRSSSSNGRIDSLTSVSPETYDAAELTRKTAPIPMSNVVPMRPKGI